jgi:ADP-heptose:LPS heptosyltransferase
MRRIGIDTVIDCELFSRVSSIFSFLSGAVIRSGFYRFTQEGLYRGTFINRPVLYNPYRHISAQFVSLVKAIESGGRPPVKERPDDNGFRAPRIRFGRREMAAFQDRFSADFPGVSGKRLVLLYPGGGLLPIRAWPAERYRAVVNALAGRGYAVGVIGMENDRGLSKIILSGAREEVCVDLTGYTRTVRELLMLFHLAALLITNDGGPGHFASLTPIPSIIFFGPETPVLYGTLDEKSVEFYAGISCSPCLTAYNHRNSPCDGDNVCLKSISVQSVLKAACEILEGTHAP